MTRPVPLLEAVALSCERDWRMLFEQLHFALQPGDMLQISGPNGSGKTSLLRLIAGLRQPTSGDILLQGQALAEQRSELARNLLWIGHAAGIKGLLTAEENLAWLCALHRPASREAIWQALQAVGLCGFEDVPCHTHACIWPIRRRCGCSMNLSPHWTRVAWRNSKRIWPTIASVVASWC
jgi:heme exporter protein A